MLTPRKTQLLTTAGPVRSPPVPAVGPTCFPAALVVLTTHIPSLLCRDPPLSLMAESLSFTPAHTPQPAGFPQKPFQLRLSACFPDTQPLPPPVTHAPCRLFSVQQPENACWCLSPGLLMVAIERVTGGSSQCSSLLPCRSPVPGPLYWLFLCLWHFIHSHVQNLRASDNKRYLDGTATHNGTSHHPSGNHSHHHKGTTALPQNHLQPLP